MRNLNLLIPRLLAIALMASVCITAQAADSFTVPQNATSVLNRYCTEYPFIVMAGDNAKLDLGRRYIRLPNYGQEGHKTLGNWYTTLLNAYGNPIEHYGALDVGLKNINQEGSIPQLMG